MTKQIQSRLFTKEYIAIVYGIIEQDFGTIDMPIKREPDSIMTRMVARDGDKAVTHFEVIKRMEDMTVIRLKLETGRTHQIRVHCKAIGHPILGDGLYSDRETDLIHRQALHSPPPLSAPRQLPEAFHIPPQTEMLLFSVRP